jgi:hypothetical protein
MRPPRPSDCRRLEPARHSATPVPRPSLDDVFGRHRRREHPADALGVQGEHANGHVPELHRDGHVVDRRDLLAGELTRDGAGAAAAVVEAA